MTVQARLFKSSMLTGSGVLERASSPEQVAFVQLYDEYFPRVYNYARYRCGDVAAADDLAAQTFERALSNFKHFDPQRAPFGAWLFTIARNLVSNHLRAVKRTASLSLDACEERPSPIASPEERLIQMEAQTELLAALGCLSERESDLLSLKFAAGLTNRRIAEIAGLTEANVGVILYRALQQLRVILVAKQPK